METVISATIIASAIMLAFAALGTAFANPFASLLG